MSATSTLCLFNEFGNPFCFCFAVAYASTRHNPYCRAPVPLLQSNYLRDYPWCYLPFLKRIERIDVLTLCGICTDKAVAVVSLCLAQTFFLGRAVADCTLHACHGCNLTAVANYLTFTGVTFSNRVKFLLWCLSVVRIYFFLCTIVVRAGSWSCNLWHNYKID